MEIVLLDLSGLDLRPDRDLQLRRRSVAVGQEASALSHLNLSWDFENKF